MKIGKFLLEGKPKVGIVKAGFWIESLVVRDIVEKPEDIVSFLNLDYEQKMKIKERVLCIEPGNKMAHSLDAAQYLAPVGEYANLYSMRGISTIFSRACRLVTPTQPTYDMRYTHNFEGHNCTAVFTEDTVPGGWNQEFIAVIGRQAKDVSKKDAYNYIGGYTLLIDHSGYHKRSPFYRDGMWKMNEDDMDMIDHFYRTNYNGNAFFPLPIGPYITTSDEVDNPHNILSKEEESGRLVSVGSSEGLLLQFDEVVSYISKHMTLMPGDMISSSSISYDSYKHWDSHEEGSFVQVSMEGIGSLKMNIVDKRGKCDKV